MTVDRPQHCKLHLVFRKEHCFIRNSRKPGSAVEYAGKKRHRAARYEREGANEGGRCRYAKDAPDDRQFLSSRRHRHRLKIQFEKFNNTAQFARKCVSRSSSDGIVRRVDTMRPIGGGPPLSPLPLLHPWIFTTFAVRDFFSTTDSPLLPPPPLHMPALFVSLQLFFFHDGRRFGCTRARGIIVGALPRGPICIPRSKSDRPRWFSIWRRRRPFFHPPRVFLCTLSTLTVVSMILI